MKRAGVYCRVSTSDQSVAMQLDELREYADKRDFDIVAEYVDEGVSGAKTKRPGLNAMMEDARRRKFDLLLVWKVDRLGRSLSHLVRLVDEFGALGVDLVSLCDPGLDTSTPQGKLVFAVVGACAEFERALAVERTRAAMRAAKRRGKRIGRPRVFVSRVKLAQGVERGASIAALARELGVSRHVVRRELTEMGLSERNARVEGASARDAEAQTAH